LVRLAVDSSSESEDNNMSHQVEKMMFAGDQKVDPEKNILIRMLRKIMPVTSTMEDQSFFKRIDGRLWATPLLVCLVFVEATDIVFAIDSVSDIAFPMRVRISRIMTLILSRVSDGSSVNLVRNSFVCNSSQMRSEPPLVLSGSVRRSRGMKTCTHVGSMRKYCER
jgi:hypothetical protein